MNYKIIIGGFIDILVFMGLIFWFVETNRNVTMHYEETTDSLDNPGQGYYVQIDSSQFDTIKTLRKEGNRLVLVGMDLQKYRDCEIEEEALQNVRKCLIEARKNDMQVIFRGAYNFYGSCVEPDNITRIQKHMEQIAAILNEEKDVIASVQAGMIGDYGEWHDGRYLTGNGKRDKKIRCTILKTWEKYLAKEIKVSVRRPRFIREAQKEQILVNRLGYHNDGLLASDTDLGTYDDPKYRREDELNWMEKNILGQHNGGEMPMVSDWSDAFYANQEFMKMHASYLNRYYNVEVIEQWKQQTIGTQNAETYISSHLGYRYYIKSIKVKKYLKNGKIKVDITVVNTGYNIPNKPYQMYFVVVNQKGERKEFLVASEILSTICNGEKVTLHETFNLKQFFQKEEEEYRCFLYLAQEDDRIENRILLANEWKANKKREYLVFTYKKGDGRLSFPLQVHYEL